MKGGSINLEAFRLREHLIDWTAVKEEIGILRSILSIYLSCLSVWRHMKAFEHRQQPQTKPLASKRAEIIWLVCNLCDFAHLKVQDWTDKICIYPGETPKLHHLVYRSVLMWQESNKSTHNHNTHTHTSPSHKLVPAVSVCFDCDVPLNQNRVRVIFLFFLYQWVVSELIKVLQYFSKEIWGQYICCTM